MQSLHSKNFKWLGKWNVILHDSELIALLSMKGWRSLENTIGNMTTSRCSSFHLVHVTTWRSDLTYLNKHSIHPYYKLAYIKMAWGGPEEQARKWELGNIHAKDWQDEDLIKDWWESNGRVLARTIMLCCFWASWGYQWNHKWDLGHWNYLWIQI